MKKKRVFLLFCFFCLNGGKPIPYVNEDSAQVLAKILIRHPEQEVVPLVVHELLGKMHNITVNVPFKVGSERHTASPFIATIISRNFVVAECMMGREDFSVNMQDELLRTPLHHTIDAAFNSFDELYHDFFTKLLAHRKTILDLPDRDGVTPLMLSAQRGNLTFFELLLEYGADSKICDKYSRDVKAYFPHDPQEKEEFEDMLLHYQTVDNDVESEQEDSPVLTFYRQRPSPDVQSGHALFYNPLSDRSSVE